MLTDEDIGGRRGRKRVMPPAFDALEEEGPGSGSERDSTELLAVRRSSNKRGSGVSVLGEEQLTEVRHYIEW